MPVPYSCALLVEAITMKTSDYRWRLPPQLDLSLRPVLIAPVSVCWLVQLLLVHEVVLDVGICSLSINCKLINIHICFEITVSVNGEAAYNFFGQHVKNEHCAILATDGRQRPLWIEFND